MTARLHPERILGGQEWMRFCWAREFEKYQQLSGNPEKHAMR